MATTDELIRTKGSGPVNDIDEHIRLLQECSDEPNLNHGKALNELPEWFDKEKFRRGQRFFNDNYYSMFVSKLCGLLVILSIPKVLQILIMTQKSSTPEKAFKRYLSTLIHMLTWYNGDLTDETSRAHKSLREVYSKHSAANKRGLSEKVGSLSQSSLAITQFGFMGFSVIFPEKLGIKIADDKDVEGFIHFWRVTGYLIGIDDRYNICRGTVAETKETCQRILKEILWPNLKAPTKEFTEMIHALLLGMWVIIPFIDVEAFKAFTYDLAGLDFQPLTNWWSRRIYNYQKFVHQILNNSLIGGIIRPILNFFMWLAIYLSSKYPFWANFYFGISNKLPKMKV